MLLWLLKLAQKYIHGDPSAHGLGYVGVDISFISYGEYPETELMTT